jgi:hypothetical protein
VPTFVATSQASHSPPHVALQQTPSAQMPETHETPEAHAFPFATLGTQLPALHQLPAVQSVFAVQLVLHAVAPHTNGAHVLVTAAGQVGPAPVQFVAFVCTPAAQLAARHWTLANA